MVRAYEHHTQQQRAFVPRSTIITQRLAIITSALRRLLADDHFITVLRAEDLRSLPEFPVTRLGIRPTIIEKDVWVCVALKVLFHKSRFEKSVVFKGGTSLSKAHGLIERFSEDIDLVLDWKVIGFGDGLGDPKQELRFRE